MVNKIYLKQIYCSYSRTHNSENGFLLLFSVIIFEDCCWTETNILVKIFCFF